jgi:beta-lactam-binding protein with PASTA domain
MLQGAFRDRLEGPSGTRRDGAWRANLVVWSALDLIGALLCNHSTGVTYLAVGSGDPAWDTNPPPPDRGRTLLAAEVFRVRLEPGRTLTYDPATGRVHVRVSIGRGKATGTLRELGLFGGDASARPGSGTLVNHAVHPRIEKAENDTLLRELFLALEETLAPGARDLIGGLLARRKGLAGITHVALGTNGETPAEPRRDLLAEAYRKPLAPSALSYDSFAHAVDARARFEIGEGPAEVREAGLFGGNASERPDTGFLVARDTGAAVDRREPKRLERRFRLVLVEKTNLSVPAVVGETLDAARAKLVAAELRVGTLSLRETETDPASTVLEQTPSAGASVNEGAAVALVLAVRPTVTVPEIVGEPETEAKTLLRRLGLVVTDDGRVEQQSPRAAGTVLASSPPPGAVVPKGTSVSLTVAVPVQARVPDVRGRTPESAALVLGGVGLAVAPEPFSRQESGASPGTVVAQEPEPGASVVVGTEVKLTLATPWTVVVPNLKGKKLDEAQDLLAAAATELIARLNLPPGLPGLGLGAVEERAADSPAGTILEQSPAAGARASLYTAVDVVVSTAATAEVPSLIGLTEAGAATTLAAAGFAVGKVSQRAAEAAPGTVVDQDPAPGVRWARSARVSITLAAGRRVTVPDVVGLELEAAREAIIGRALVPGSTTTRVEPGEPGTVFSQRPAAREAVAPGTRVNLVLRAGVPNVVGMTQTDARATIEAAGVPLDRVDTREADGPVDVVLEQQPAPGTPVGPDTRMRLIVSIARRGEVPALIGSTLESAKRTLAAAGLGLEVADKEQSDEREGSILRQDPAAGTLVDRGSVVRVTIAVPRRRRVSVPSVIGLPEIQARNVLAAVGLVIDVAGSRPTPDARPGTVVTQKPAEGTDVEAGSVVRVVLASADDTIEVPDVRHLPFEAAAARLRGASLGIQKTDSTASVEPEGTVLNQDPIPGSRVPAGSVVSVVLSAGGVVAVPSVVGLDERAAVTLLARRRLQAEVVETIGGRPGTVVSQSPEAGTGVAVDSVVTLVVARRRIFDPDDVILGGGRPDLDDLVRPRPRPEEQPGDEPVA